MSNYLYKTRKRGVAINAGSMGNHTRFINHSCSDDNCEIFSEIINGVPKNWVVAKKDVQIG